MFTPHAVLAAFTYILELLPFHFIAYYPFRDRLRFPVWLTFVLAGSNMAAEFFACCYCYYAGQDARSLDLFFAVTSIIIYFSCVNAELPKLIFIYVLVVDYIMIVRGISVFLIIQFFYEPGSDYILLGSPSGTIIRLIPCILTTPLILHFFNLTKERVLRSQAPQLWSTIWLLPTLTTAAVLLFTWNLNMASVQGLLFLLSRVCLLIMTLIVYYQLIASLEALRLQGEAEERARNQEQLIAMQLYQYNQMQRQIEETRQARHDLKQHLNLIQAYIDRNDMETLKDYIQKYGQKLPLYSDKLYCSNSAVDLIIRYYAEKAAAANIEFEPHLQLPQELSVDEPDICVLFGNLLENAIDACLQLHDQPAFIRVHARMAGEYAISITVDNSCAAAPVQSNNRFLSTKHSGFGMGTLSIRNIAAQYHGIVDFKCSNGVFYASVFLNPRKVRTD